MAVTAARSLQSVPSSLGDKPSSKPPAKPPTLTRRLLFPHLSPETALPPLLLSPSAEPTLNAELYDFLALALRAYVHPWWSKITRYDKSFLPELTRVITAVLRALETRLTRTDFSPLVFRDVPTLLAQHYTDYRAAHAKLSTSYAASGAATLPQLFHQIQAHMAIDPDGNINEAYVRQAVDHILKACLPEEDYQPDAERYIVREIVVNVLLTAIVPKLVQPWFIHKLILDQLGPEDEQHKPSPKPPEPVTEPPSPASRYTLQRHYSHGFSFQSLAIFFLSAIQSLAGACIALIHLYKQALGTIKRANQHAALGHSQSAQEPDPDDTRSTAQPSTTLPGGLLPATPTIPPPNDSSTASVFSLSRASSVSPTPTPPQPSPEPTPTPPPPDYARPLLRLLSTLLTPHPPHLTSATTLAFRHVLNLVLTPLTPMITRLLPYLLYTHVLSPTSLSAIVRNARRTLFPEGWPAPPPANPGPNEQAEMRKEVGRRLGELVPSTLAPLLGTTPAARAHTIDGLLDPLSSAECNAHLVLFMFDLVLVTVFPEMAVSESEGGAGVSTDGLEA